MSRLLAPWDAEAVAVEMASGQSSCALAVCAMLLMAEVDGLVRAWRGRTACDPLRLPRAGHYDAIMYLETLAMQRGLHRRPGRERPGLRPGVYYLIDSSPHVEMAVTDVAADGTYEVVAGGQNDPRNPRAGAANCTAIGRKTRRLAGGPGHWTVDGRPLVYTCDAGLLPTTSSGMPWETIGVQP